MSRFILRPIVILCRLFVSSTSNQLLLPSGLAAVSITSRQEAEAMDKYYAQPKGTRMPRNRYVLKHVVLPTMGHDSGRAPWQFTSGFVGGY